MTCDKNFPSKEKRLSGEKEQPPKLDRVKITCTDGGFNGLRDVNRLKAERPCFLPVNVSLEFETKQHFSLSASGRVSFSAYDDYGHLVRRIKKKIPPRYAEEILGIVAEVLPKGPMEDTVCDAMPDEARFFYADGTRDAGEYFASDHDEIEKLYYLIHHYVEIAGLFRISWEDDERFDYEEYKRAMWKEWKTYRIPVSACDFFAENENAVKDGYEHGTLPEFLAFELHR